MFIVAVNSPDVLAQNKTHTSDTTVTFLIKKVSQLSCAPVDIELNETSSSSCEKILDANEKLRKGDKFKGNESIHSVLMILFSTPLESLLKHDNCKALQKQISSNRATNVSIYMQKKS